MRIAAVTVLMIVGFAITIPSIAQATCQLDIADAVAALIDAQTASASGDANAAQAALTEARAQIDGLIEACEGGEPVVENPDDVRVITPPEDVELGGVIAAEDGSYLFEYPAGWVVDESSVSSSGAPDNETGYNITDPAIERATSDDFVNTLSILIGDPFLVGRWIGVVDSSASYPLQGGLAAFEQLLSQPPDSSDVPVEVLLVQRVLFDGLPALEVRYLITDESDDTELEAVIYIIEYDVDKTYAVFAAIAELDDIDAYQSIIEAVAASAVVEQ